jgi:hypothetical protein
MSDRTNAQNDQATLTATFRTLRASRQPRLSPVQEFAAALLHLRLLMLDGWDSPDAGFPQQVFDDHGPGVILRALADAYDAPAPVLGELEGD